MWMAAPEQLHPMGDPQRQHLVPVQSPTSSIHGAASGAAQDQLQLRYLGGSCLTYDAAKLVAGITTLHDANAQSTRTVLP